MTLPSFSHTAPKQAIQARLIRQAEQLDAKLQGLENGARIRLVRSLRRSERELEKELKGLYLKALEETANLESIEWREARAKVLLAQVRSNLNIAEHAAGLKDLDSLLHQSALAGLQDALKGVTAQQAQTIMASAVVRGDVAAKATQAYSRLKHHGAKFATQVERIVTDGIIRGQGWGKTTRELRRELSITEAQANRLVRTESIRASHDARIDAFKEQGVDMAIWVATMDSSVCGYCASRSGLAYRLDDIIIPSHPNCRCTAMPMQKEWIEEGLADEEWLIEHRKEAIKRAEESGHKIHEGISPGEKYAGMTEAPEPAWRPGSGEPPKTGPVTPGGTPTPNIPTGQTNIQELFAGTGAAPVQATAPVSMPVPSAPAPSVPTPSVSAPVSPPAPTAQAVTQQVQQVVNTAKAAQQQVSAAAPVTAQPVASKAAQAAAQSSFLDESVVLGKQMAPARGSNQGGFYLGTDGVERYVKFYADEAQAYGEQLANRLYRDLGIDTPNTVLFRRADGTVGYASEIVQGQTLQSVGLNQANARSILQGFSADVLTANWDTVGMSMDNILVSSSGNVFRIDNGGSFLMRAQAGRKPINSLNVISEFSYFADAAKNPSYYRVWQASGFGGPNGMADEVLKQIAAIEKLVASSGGWAKYVDDVIPGLNASDRNLIVTMLTERTQQLSALTPQLKEAVKQNAAAAKASKAAAKKAQNIAGQGGFPSGPWNPLSYDDAVVANESRFPSFRWTGGEVDIEDSKAVVKYTGGGYTPINQHLIGLVPGTTEYEGVSVSALASRTNTAVSKSVSPVDATYYRTIALKASEFPDLNDVAAVTGLVGREIHNPAFASTSLDRNRSLVFGSPGIGEIKVLLEIRGRAGVTRGAYVAPISRHPGEMEFLMPKDVTFQVISARTEAQGAGLRPLLVLEVEVR